MGISESFKQFPIHAKDYILTDRGGQHVAKLGGYIIVRVNTGTLHFTTRPDQTFELLSRVESITRIGAVGE